MKGGDIIAILKSVQVQRRIEEEHKRQEALVEKQKLLEEKERRLEERRIFGEEKRIEEEKLSELESELGEVKGDKYVPKVYDFSDTFDFLNPIELFKDKDGEVISSDYSDFVAHEESLKGKIEEIQEDIFYENLKGEKVEEMKDGIAFLSKDTKSKKQIIAQNEVVAKYFHRFSPKYNLYVCSCCGKGKSLADFAIEWNVLYANKIDRAGRYHAPWCKECAKKLFGYFYFEKTNRNPMLAMQMLCCATNMYWSEDVFKKARKSLESGLKDAHILTEYTRLLSLIGETAGKTFWDSLEDDEKIASISYTPGESNAVFEWDKEDIQNKNTILKMVGYDPFEYETDENKRILYKDLLGMLDVGMENDLVKLQAAIQIVNSYFRVRKMDKRYAELQKRMDENEKEALDGKTKKDKDSVVTYKDLKELSDLKKKELDAITAFARDNGFSERYASAKARGENTFTGIMKKMGEQKFEKSIVNKYDIATSETIQQAAEASFKAIFSQLSLGESDVWKIAQDQLAELKKLRKENDTLKEDVRKANIEIKRITLTQEAIDNGIDPTGEK